MTNMNDVTVFDEIVNCGILEEDSVLNFGAGHSDAKFLETLRDYNGTFEAGKIIALDPDPTRIKMIAKKFKDDNISLIESSLQDYLVAQPVTSDWVVITGIFENFEYENQHADFMESVIQMSLPICNKGLIFTVNENTTDYASLSPFYFFINLSTNYSKFSIKKIQDGTYIYCIFK